MPRTRLRSTVLALALLPLLFTVPAPTAAQEAPPAPAVAAPVAEDTLGPSARGALLRSLAVPGWGQAYVGAPGRGALYFGAQAGNLWMVLKSRRQLSAARAQEAWLREIGEVGATAEAPLAQLRSQQVEDWVALAVFTALLSGADAYVAAQLADFVDHVGVGPDPAGAMQLRVTLPAGGAR